MLKPESIILEQIPQSVDYDDGKYVELEINGNLNGEEIEVKNYEADVFNAFETKIDINEDIGCFLAKNVNCGFPCRFSCKLSRACGNYAE